MKQLKKKKGFTLVELIVVIAIIAILAAVAVPTTMHFVKKANISKEAQQMDISSIIEGVFTSATSKAIDVTDAKDVKLIDALKANGAYPNESIGSLTITVTAGGTSGMWKVSYKIVGKEYGVSDANVIERTLGGEYTTSQIFANNTAVAAAAGYVTYGLDGTTGSTGSNGGHVYGA